MGKTILPSGEELKTTPEEILRYLSVDGLRQFMRQSRLHWQLKPNKEADYYSNDTLHRYTGDLHNEVQYQRMEIRTFPDNGAHAGFAGIHNDSGEFGLEHNIEKWDHAISAESLKEIVNRTQIGAMASIPGKLGYGLNDGNEMDRSTSNRMASILFDPFDGRAYLMSNDDVNYVNNETRTEKLPLRTLARIGDIPTRITDLKNDLDFVTDPDYRHTDNSFTNSNRFILDNIDDRTFVYPEISKDSYGSYIDNRRVGLNGEAEYGEADGSNYNTQPDPNGDRQGDSINSYNANKNFSGVNHPNSYLPGVFRSLEELERVDLVNQMKTPLTHGATPGARRPYNYYSFDGVWNPNWFDRYTYNDSYLAQSLHPSSMDVLLSDREPVPYSHLSQTTDPSIIDKLYQWRYNRISLKYYSKDIVIAIVDSGEDYQVGDVLRWTFTDEVILYRVSLVGPNGQIQKGAYVDHQPERILEQNPSTNGVGIPFSNMSGPGKGAKLAVSCKVTISTHASQLKNNLYAYVDVVPTVRSDNTTPWSDVNPPDTFEGTVVVRSTAAGPAYSGINSGRGGPVGKLYEHGGNATAGVQVHLFRYVINTQNPSWILKDGMQVFTGKWIDQGPIAGVERPCDIKALLFSNPDTNNFNNYYKFMLDSMFDGKFGSGDSVTIDNPNAISELYIHKAQRDPEATQRFTVESISPETGSVEELDITDKVLYVNMATGVQFIYNSSYANDPNYGYGSNPPGWIASSGVTTR